MIAVRPSLGGIQWYSRRPRNFDEMESQGWSFISERRRWDADEREVIIMLIPALYQFWAGSIWFAPDRWLKANVRLYLDRGHVIIDRLIVRENGHSEALSESEIKNLPPVLRPSNGAQTFPL